MAAHLNTSIGPNTGQTLTFFRQFFEIQERIGCGSFGDVFRCKSNIDGLEYAIKKSRRTYNGEADRARQLREVQRVVNIPYHSHLVQLERAWEEENHLYLQMELCAKSLNQKVEDGIALTETETWDVLIDMLLAVKHLHKHHLVHLDIKTDNIFLTLDSPPMYKLGDFGIVISLDEKRDVNDYMEGDSRYLAPEVMQGTLSTKADVFSLGLVILEVACHVDLPKSGHLWHELRSGGKTLPDPCDKLLPASLQEVVKKMLTPDVNERPEIDDLFELPEVKRELKRRRWILASLMVIGNSNGSSSSGSASASDTLPNSLSLTPELVSSPETNVLPDIILNDNSFSDDDELRPSVTSTPVYASTPITVSKSKSTTASTASSRFRSSARLNRPDSKLFGTPTSRNLLKEFEAVSDNE